MMPPSDPPYELEVSRADFLHAVEIVAGLMGKQPSGVSLQFEDGWLWIESGSGNCQDPGSRDLAANDHRRKIVGPTLGEKYACR